MKHWLTFTAATCILLTAGGLSTVGARGGHGADDPPGDDHSRRALRGNPHLTQTVLEFRTMVGVDGPFLGSANPIRGVNGGGLPWVLDAARGELRDNGRLEVEVEGLVIPGSSSCGFDCNPASHFRALVSCVTVDAATGEVITQNVLTENGAEVMIGDPRNGDAKIKATVALPDTCLAPIVFVTSPGGAWFSVTGTGSLR